jgi:hypothetical protein
VDVKANVAGRVRALELFDANPAMRPRGDRGAHVLAQEYWAVAKLADAQNAPLKIVFVPCIYHIHVRRQRMGVGGGDE